MIQLLAAILFMGALIVSLGVIAGSLLENAAQIAAALNREPQPERVIKVRVRRIRLGKPQREFSRGPSRQQQLRAAA